EIFNDYIANVLPELGEENMRRLTLHETASRILGRPTESLSDQMEYLLSHRDDAAYRTRIAGIAFKGSPQFLEILRRYVDLLEQGVLASSQDFTFHGKSVITREEI